MSLDPLTALSPLDGRYRSKTKELAALFSEASLFRHRVRVEVEYLLFLSKKRIIRTLSSKEQKKLKKLLELELEQIKQIKTIEAETHHDVKAVEYFLTEQLQSTSLKDCIPFIHFGLTSADTNNLAYRLMINQAHQQIMLPLLIRLLSRLKNMSSQYQDLAMLARTHGQPALPTTLGKEISVWAVRLLQQIIQLVEHKLNGKLTGAVGSFQALQFTFPDVDWIEASHEFVSSLGLEPNLHTTQINPADNLIELLNHYQLTNSILIDLCQDFWRYISDNWLIQIKDKQQVGSSTMPQKINPIRFENCEGNLQLANGVIDTLSRKLAVSRLQRDLSNSTVNRNIGLVFGYSLLGWKSLSAGLTTVQPNKPKISTDLNQNFNILAEAMQTKLRQQQDPQAYQKTAELTKSKCLKKKDWQQLVKPISTDLHQLTPEDYTGLAAKLVTLAVEEIGHFLAEFKPDFE